MFVRTSESAQLHNPAILKILLHFGWTKVALLARDHDLVIPVINNFLSLKCVTRGLSSKKNVIVVALKSQEVHEICNNCFENVRLSSNGSANAARCLWQCKVLNCVLGFVRV